MSQISHFSRILLLLTLALLPRLAQAQRIGPLGPTDRQQSKALSTERTAAVRPPSLQLSLSPPAAVALPPLGPDDLQRLQPQEGRAPLIGVHRRLPAGAVTRSFSGGAVKTTAEGAWQSTAVGRLWRLKMTSPSARAMRIHFRDFAIGAGSLWLYSASGQVVGPYTGSGLYGDGDFWSGIVFGDSLTIEYLPDGASAKEAVPFQIVEISHIWDDAFGGGVEGGVRWPQGALGSSDRRGSLKPLPDRINVAVGTQLKKSRLTKAIQLVERSASLQQPRPKAARPLTPGRPVSFSLGPVDAPTLFSGDSSFRLEVPDNASRVTFTLESVDPDVDVDLYVRFGEDNAVQDRRVVTDYSSEGLTGNEEIVITRQSDPPLRAGTYFVSVGIFDTGVVAMCTLTAEVELDGEAPPPTSDGTLTPSQPVSFQRGPVDNPRLFARNDSFRLEVPEDASRVTFTLESDVDVELAVRYGEDNAVEDRSLVTDHRSRNPAGNERILITPRSDPPLRSGTYFVSVIVWATGVVANCTLTAEVELDEEDQTPISGGTLTPEQPTDFRLGPVDTPTIFTGNHSFRLEAPEAASRITFTLESVDPDVDVDLYVRFGEDNMIQNGRPVFDHRSQKLTGNERIGITRRSDPPLRAGTYFVSIAVRSKGVVAEGTITATVETDAADCHLDVTCYPEWSSSATGVARIFFETSEGGSRACSGTLLNNRRQDLTPYFLTAAHCVGTEEEARSVTAFWLYQTQTCNGELPDFQSVPHTEGASLLSTLGGGGRNPDGDMTLLQLEGDLPDDVMFQGWDADPQPIGAQVTGIHHPGSDWGFFKRISFGQIIPDPASRISADVYAFTSYTQGYTEGGSSGSALFSSPGTVVGALSFGRGEAAEKETACRTGRRTLSGYTHFSVFYPHVRQFIDPLPTSLKIFSGGIVLATGTPVVNRIAPNAIITVFGEDFAPAGTQAVSPQLDDGGKVATKLANTCLEIDGDRAPLFAVFPTQINAQAPHLLQPTQATVEVIRGCGTQDEQRSPAETVAVAPLAPAFFNFVSNPGGHNPIVALHGGGPGLVGESGLIPGVTFTPAQPNEFVSFFGTGFGPTDPALESGQIPSQALPNSQGVADLTNEVTFTIGGIAVPPEDVFYAGAAPCCAGLLQFVVRVPPNAPDGNLGVVATVGGVSTPDGPFITVMQPLGIPMLAPADEAAFNDLVVGKRVATNYPTVYVDFVSPGRFRATEGADTYTGSYTYQNTGSNTGTLTFNYDDGDRCTTHLTFASAMAGTATFTCNDGSSGAYDWRLVEIPPDDGDGDTNGVCATGSTIESGSECALQYPQGSPDAGRQFGRFAVGVQLGSEKGCLYIGAGFLACGSSSISRDLTFTIGSGNEYSFGFAASKIEDSSSWRISKLSITLQE